MIRRMTSFHARTSVNASNLSPCPWYSHLLPHAQKMPPNVVYLPILLLPRKHKTKTKAWFEIKSNPMNWEGCLSEWNNLPKLKSWQRKHADCVWMPFSSYHGLDNRTVKVYQDLFDCISVGIHLETCNPIKYTYIPWREQLIVFSLFAENENDENSENAGRYLKRIEKGNKNSGESWTKCDKKNFRNIEILTFSSAIVCTAYNALTRQCRVVNQAVCADGPPRRESQ